MAQAERLRVEIGRLTQSPTVGEIQALRDLANKEIERVESSIRAQQEVLFDIRRLIHVIDSWVPSRGPLSVPDFASEFEVRYMEIMRTSDPERTRGAASLVRDLNREIQDGQDPNAELVELRNRIGREVFGIQA